MANDRGRDKPRPTASANIRRMIRRGLCVLLMLFLPLQLGWAAVSSICAHESDGQAKHLGHHEHEHQADQNEVPDTDRAAQPGPDGDCGACHTLGSTAVLSGYALITLAGGTALLADRPLTFPSAPTAPPERPDWSGLA